jgi:hypothetical protein
VLFCRWSFRQRLEPRCNSRLSFTRNLVNKLLVKKYLNFESELLPRPFAIDTRDSLLLANKKRRRIKIQPKSQLGCLKCRWDQRLLLFRNEGTGAIEGGHSKVTGCSGKVTRTIDGIKRTISHQLADEKRGTRGRKSNYLYPSSPHRISSLPSRYKRS